MRQDETERDHRRALADAVQKTIAAGSARVRYRVDANPPELADADFGEGVANFRERTSRVTYSFSPDRVHPDIREAGPIEQVISGETTFIRFGGPGGEWEQLPIGDSEGFAPTGDAGGYLDLLTSPGDVTLLTTDGEIDGHPTRRYAVVIDAPRSLLRTALAMSFRRRAPRRFWLDAWIDADGRVRRMAVSNRKPNPDGSLPRGTVRTTVDLDQLGVPASVEVPRGA